MHTYSIGGNKITSIGAGMLFRTLKERGSSIIFINLHSNQIDDNCMRELGEYIEGNQNIAHVHLGSNKISDKGIEVLSEYVIGNIALKTLDFSNNIEITNESASICIDIARMSGISTIGLYKTYISDDKKQEITNLLLIPTDLRGIPIKSYYKSAAKSLHSTSVST